MWNIILKVFTIYTLRNGSYGHLKAIRLIGGVDRALFVWVNLLARVHLRCVEKIWVDDVEHGWKSLSFVSNFPIVSNF